MRVHKKCACHKHPHTPQNSDQMRSRCKKANAILETCDELIKFKASRSWLAQCHVCGTLWNVEYPFGEQFGGSPCPYAVPTPKHAKPDRLDKVRQTEEDLAWFETLGPEVGPEICACKNCERLRIAQSKYCTLHYFRRVKGYRVPGT